MKGNWLGLLFISSVALADSGNTIQTIMNDHLKQYGAMEHFSAIQVSVMKGNSIQHYTAGKRSLDTDSPALSSEDLFEIGSITKSFTAALAVMAERDGKLSLKDTLGQHLKQYPDWSNLTLSGLLDMSTGIPNYSNSPTMNYQFSKNLRYSWSHESLMALAYPKTGNPPRLSGYFYSNTGYVLMDMILSKQYHQPFPQLIRDHIFIPLKLQHMFYPLPEYPAGVMKQKVRGYSWNIYDNPELLGLDVTDANLSWAGAAGAIVANSAAVLSWVNHLFIEDKLLSKSEKRTMQSMISITTGKSVSQTDKDNPKAFGLGISQGYDEQIGRYWFYEGKTLGYRAIYMCKPEEKFIIVALFNSATNAENDHVGELIQKLYPLIQQL